MSADSFNEAVKEIAAHNPTFFIDKNISDYLAPDFNTQSQRWEIKFTIKEEREPLPKHIQDEISDAAVKHL